MRSFKNQRGAAFIELLLLLLVLIVLALVGWRWYQSQDARKTTANPPTQQQTAGPYDGWKTYTSVADGLSFKYPGDWTLKKDPTTVDVEGKKYEKATLTGPNNFQIKYSLRHLDGIGGACPECGVYEVETLTVPNYNLEDVYQIIHGPDNATQTASTVGLESDPAGGNYTPAVGPGFSFNFMTSKLGGAYKTQLLGAYYDANGNATSTTYNIFKTKPEVLIAKKIFKSVSY